MPLKILKLTFMSLIHVVFFPIHCVMNIFNLIFSEKKDSKIKIFTIFLDTFLLVCWITIFIMITHTSDVSWLTPSMGTLVAMKEEGLLPEGVNLEPTSTLNNAGSSTGNGTVDVNGMNFIIDINSVPDDIQLPSGTYQNGTPKQRAELLLIVQEICNRPEIKITPQQLLGLYYVECTAYIGCSGSMVSTTWQEEYNAYGCGGPFQHMDSGWYGGGGKAFISTLEDPNLSDAERVKDYQSAQNLPKINGMSRPCMFFFPDAAYTAALRLSEGVDGTQSYYHWTPDVKEWASGQGLSNEIINLLAYNSSLAYYNSYTKVAKSWLPSFYADLMKTEGSIDKWYTQAGSRAALNSKLKELMGSVPRTLPNFTDAMPYYETYQIALDNSNWESTQYPFVAANGGKWVYEGLVTLASKVGTVENTNTSGGTVSGTVGADGAMSKQDFDILFSIAKKYLGVPYLLTSDLSGMCPPKNFCCASYISYIFTEAGYKGVTSWSASAIFYDSCYEIQKSDLQPGDLLFFEKTYNGANRITHIGMYIGDNQMIHSGDPVQIVSLETNYWQSHMYKFGRVKTLDKSK